MSAGRLFIHSATRPTAPSWTKPVGARAMDEILGFFLNLLDAMAVQGLTEVFFAILWGAGAFCSLYRLGDGRFAIAAAVVAFIVALWLTFLSSKSVKWARNTLLIGVLLALFPIVLLAWKGVTP